MQRMMDYDRDIVQEVQSKQNLGGREMLSCMRKGISVCVVVVVLMVVVGVDSVVVVVVVVEVEVDNFKLGMECYEAGLVVFEWDGGFPVTFSSDVGGRESV